MTRHYCYVPGKGAYMLAEEPAAVKMQAGINDQLSQIAAPRRVVRFSALHYHDDGLLANLLMEAEGMTYDEACHYIERQAALLTDDFLQSAALHTDIEHFGFADLSLDTWSAIEQKRAWAAAPAEGQRTAAAVATPTLPQHPSDSFVIPKYWVRRAAAIVLVIICFFSNFLGLNDNNPQQQLANVLNMAMLQRPVLMEQNWNEEEINEEFQTADFELLAFNTTEQTDETQEAEATEPVEAAGNDAPALATPSHAAPAQSTSSQSPEMLTASSVQGRIYYIIVASCATEADANRALGNLSNAGYQGVGLLERDERFRLFINCFTEREQAEAYLSQVRGIERFHDAWLLPVRNNSLSHIIKNSYNDNQLSMELSHLNQRTERDQG